MLGVLKRRWKPKRATNGHRLSMDGLPAPLDKPNISVRVHPCEDKHMLAYDQQIIETSPPTPSYPLQPNICVEGGRIEFIRSAPDGERCTTPLAPAVVNGTVRSECLANGTIKGKITVNRGLQTEFEDEKENLETRIAELEEALEAAKRTEVKDKQALAKLQKQLQRRESERRDVERERRLRCEGEMRLREATAEAQKCRHRLKILTHEFSRMEETVRAMLVYKSRAEQLKQEKNALAVAFESRTHHYQQTIQRLNNEVHSLRQQLDSYNSGRTSPTDGRVAALEADNAVLCRDAEVTRRQYERCLDDVANQVVRALLAQKNLREEISTLTRRIKDLESQNRALTTLLVHQLRENSEFDISKSPLALESSQNSCSENYQSLSPISSSSLNIKHCNSFNSENLNDLKPSPSQKHLSADSEILEAGFSFEDKKRHQVLTKLWTDLKGSEVTPQRLIEALSNVDSALFVTPQRPVSLNLQLPILQSLKCRRTRPILAQSSSKSEEETGNESPESGNRDEGYSTMSSDVQEVTRQNEGPPCGLEDLKEATDETDLADTRIIVMEDSCDPDILYIPLSFAFGLNPRNSYPPTKSILPFQHIMRSFSDSHLCLKITTAPSPCYSLSSPISSSPSILLLDISERIINPLRRTKGTTFLPEDENSNDCEYVQQWLKIDETRNILQEQNRDLLELEYDRAELEDWSLNLSSEDINWRKSNEMLTPGQISLQTLPSIQENNALELEEDSNEDLWNNSSYLMDKSGGEIVALLMDTPLNGKLEKRWPYNNHNLNSCDSWSSQETNSEDCFNEQETYSKRSSVALSDENEMNAIGTDFTRDFYRLVKFESTKSLASISSKSDRQKLNECDRDQALQNVLTFIAEQQIYCSNREENSSRPNSSLQEQKDFNVEAPPQEIHENEYFNEKDENYVSLKQLCCEMVQKQNAELVKNDICQNDFKIEVNNELNDSKGQSESLSQSSCSAMSESQTSSLSTPDTVISRIPRRTSTPIKGSPKKTPPPKHPIKSKIPSNINRSPKKTITKPKSNITPISDSVDNTDEKLPELSVNKVENKPKTTEISECSDSKLNNTSENYKKNLKSVDFKSKTSRKFDLTSKSDSCDLKSNQTSENILKTPISVKKDFRPKTSPKPNIKSDNFNLKDGPFRAIITSESLPQCNSGLLTTNIIDGPPHRAVSFHERATSKDVIEELNRIIRKVDENGSQEENLEKNKNLDEACKPTGWVHVEKHIDLNDAKARENLIDVMLASSDSSPTSSCGGSISSESTDDPLDYGHLHRIHRFNRQRKASAVRPKNAVLRYPPQFRPCIIGRDDFYVRYGEKEKEAVASFDFLDEFSTGSLTSSIEEDIKEEELVLPKGDCEKLL